MFLVFLDLFIVEFQVIINLLIQMLVLDSKIDIVLQLHLLADSCDYLILYR